MGNHQVRSADLAIAVKTRYARVENGPWIRFAWPEHYGTKAAKTPRGFPAPVLSDKRFTSLPGEILLRRFLRCDTARVAWDKPPAFGSLDILPGLKAGHPAGAYRRVVPPNTQP